MENNASKELEFKKEKRQNGFQTLLSFAGTLSADFDYADHFVEVNKTIAVPKTRERI